MTQLLGKFLIFIIIFSLGLGVGSKYIPKNTPINSLVVEKNTSKAFVGEIYDKIKENFWDNISDVSLLELFKLSITQNGGVVKAPKFDNKEQLLNNISENIKNKSGDEKNKFLSSIVNSVLVSLNPTGRSGLYTQKLEEQLKNTVENRNPQTGKVEPTIYSKIIKGGILYVQFKKFSPTSYDEFIKAFESYKNDNNLVGLIFDLRGNIGGAIDTTPYFLGNFLGKGQSAYEFYHKGEYLPFKTPTEKLASIAKYKQVVILVDNNTQSSAEIMAASFKKYHTGIVVGVPTKGWGTVERVFPLDNQISKTEKYSIFLVHSITLRDDNQPIEGRGVEPNINIKDSNWQQQLMLYFNSPNLVEAVKEVI